jgi:Tfp pilus assembly protein PilN
MKINLLPKDERPLRQSQVRWEFVIGLVGVLLLGVVSMLSVAAKLEVASLIQQEEAALAREARLLAEVRVVNEIRKELQDVGAQEELIQSLFVSNATFATAIPALSNHGFSGLWIETLQGTESGLEVHGYTEDMTSLSRYLYFLGERSEEVQIGSITTAGNTGFRMFRLVIRGGQAHGSLASD